MIKNNRRVWKSLLSILVVQALIFMYAYYFWYPKEFARDWQYGHSEVVDYVIENEDKYDQIVFTKWFGEPQLFLAFYGQWDPNEFQKLNKSLIEYENEGKLWIDQLEKYSLGKYEFKYINWQEETRSENTLYVGKFDDFYVDSDYLYSVYYPSGFPAFHVVRGEKNL